MVTAPLLQGHLPTKAPEESGPSVEGEGKGNVAFLLILTQPCCNRSWVPPLQEGLTEIIPLGMGVGG